MGRSGTQPQRWTAEFDAIPHSRPLLIIAAVSTVLVTVGLAVTAPLLLVPFALSLGAAGFVATRAGRGLSSDQIERLRQAEGSLAAAASTEDAARELAEHAIALLDAPSAVVLIEGIGDTVRVGQGDASGQKVYGDGSRMRLLSDDGVPCGSIAVSARTSGKPYSAFDERILDALAERVSSTLHRLSLFNEVQDERRTLADVLTSSSDGIFSVGPDHRIRSWNPAMERITGVQARDALGEQSSVVFKPVDESGEPRFGQGDPGRIETPTAALTVSFEAVTGSHRWLTCSWSPLSAGGYVVVARDETERKKLQDDKDGWVAQVSHELRTPLTPIKGFLHTLVRRDEQLEHADRQKIYEVMLREQARLEDLVDSLLQATSLDEDEIVVTEVVDWKEAVSAQAESHSRSDVTREIEVRFADRLPAVVADLDLANGVLSNLISNALKYGAADRPIRITVGHRDDTVTTTVADGGLGVPVDDRERVFEKFTRLGDHLTRPQQGVGLGLFIARRSVERLGGEIWVDEAEGGGAAFSFTLPVHEEALDLRSQPDPPAVDHDSGGLAAPADMTASGTDEN